MNQHVKNQHYVPQFLLRNFSIDKEEKFIWAYDRDERFQNQIKKKAIRKVASEKFFYDQIKNNEFGSYEYMLQKIEDKTAPIIARIIDRKSIRDISEQDRSTLSDFILFQLFRTKKQLKETDDWKNAFIDKLREWKIEIEEINSKQTWFSELNKAVIYRELFTKKVWQLCESNDSFYISDNPVTRQNDTIKSKFRSTLGFDSPGVEFYFPLSSSFTLCLYCEKMFRALGYNKNWAETQFCSEEEVKRLNWLQVIYSKRFIFSSKDNLDLVRDILKHLK